MTSGLPWSLHWRSLNVRRRPDTTAILVAAGAGRRLGRRRENGRQKAFRRLGGKPIIFYSLRVLESSPEINGIVVVVSKRAIQRTRLLVTRSGFRKVSAIVAGGRRRQDSVANGLRFAGESDFVLVHDAARPFLTAGLVARTLRASRRTGAALAALPVSDTVKKVVRGRVAKTVSREDLWFAQTPQAFKRSLLEAALRHWPEMLLATDDALVLERFGKTVSVVPGDRYNIKVTYAEDLRLAECLVRSRK